MNAVSIVEMWTAIIVLRGYSGQTQVHINLCQRVCCVQNTFGSMYSDLRAHLCEEFALQFADPVLRIQNECLVLLQVGSDKTFARRKCLLAHIVGWYAAQLRVRYLDKIAEHLGITNFHFTNTLPFPLPLLPLRHPLFPFLHPPLT